MEEIFLFLHELHPINPNPSSRFEGFWIAVLGGTFGSIGFHLFLFFAKIDPELLTFTSEIDYFSMGLFFLFPIAMVVGIIGGLVTRKFILQNGTEYFAYDEDKIYKYANNWCLFISFVATFFTHFGWLLIAQLIVSFTQSMESGLETPRSNTFLVYLLSRMNLIKSAISQYEILI
jgi:hypothetical protein